MDLHMFKSIRYMCIYTDTSVHTVAEEIQTHTITRRHIGQKQIHLYIFLPRIHKHIRSHA